MFDNQPYKTTVRASSLKPSKRSFGFWSVFSYQADPYLLWFDLASIHKVISLLVYASLPSMKSTKESHHQGIQTCHLCGKVQCGQRLGRVKCAFCSRIFCLQQLQRKFGIMAIANDPNFKCPRCTGVCCCMCNCQKPPPHVHCKVYKVRQNKVWDFTFFLQPRKTLLLKGPLGRIPKLSAPSWWKNSVLKRERFQFPSRFLKQGSPCQVLPTWCILSRWRCVQSLEFPPFPS